jgi:hypothetical protein
LLLSSSGRAFLLPAVVSGAVAPPAAREGLTDSKEGRLTIIVAAAGLFLVATTFANVLGNNAADRAAGDVRASLRAELAELPDDADLTFPADATPIEDAVDRALGSQGGRLIAVGRPDHRRMTVVAVETGWTWWLRCVRAELRGDHTVLTRVAHGPC